MVVESKRDCLGASSPGLPAMALVVTVPLGWYRIVKTQRGQGAVTKMRGEGLLKKYSAPAGCSKGKGTETEPCVCG